MTLSRSSVRVPVLSMHNTSIAPRLWIAGSRLATTPRPRSTACARISAVVVTTGSIPGTRPTAAAAANRPACTQVSRVNPVSSSTSGTAASMSRMSVQETAVTPRSNALRPRRLGRSWSPAAK